MNILINSVWYKKSIYLHFINKQKTTNAQSALFHLSLVWAHASIHQVDEYLAHALGQDITGSFKW